MDSLLYPLAVHLGLGVMAVIKIDFEWTKAFAKAPGEPAYEIRDGKIRQIGRGTQRYSPLAAHQSLYLHFSQLGGASADSVAFAERWGLLTTPANSSNPPAEDLSFWRSEIRKMRGLIQMLPTVVRVANSRGTYARVGSLDVLLVPGTGPDARPVMVMEPHNLLQAMNLQMAQFVAGGGSHVPCQECSRLFEAGGPSGKRTVAKFCSDACRNKFHYKPKGVVR
jgi:hypothetical protein